MKVSLPGASRVRRRPDPYALELEVPDERFLRLDHGCPGAGAHRLLLVTLAEGERARLREGRNVSLVVACDRCIWERRLVLRLRPS